MQIPTRQRWLAVQARRATITSSRRPVLQLSTASRSGIRAIRSSSMARLEQDRRRISGGPKRCRPIRRGFWACVEVSARDSCFRRFRTGNHRNIRLLHGPEQHAHNPSRAGQYGLECRWRTGANSEQTGACGGSHLRLLRRPSQQAIGLYGRIRRKCGLCRLCSGAIVRSAGAFPARRCKLGGGERLDGCRWQ